MLSLATAVSRLAVFIAGLVVGLAAAARNPSQTETSISVDTAVRNLQIRIEHQERLVADQIAELDSRVHIQQQRLDQGPSLSQILAATEQLVASRVESLESKLSCQLKSIEALKVVATETDELVQKLLENVEALCHQERDTSQGSIETAGDSGITNPALHIL